MTIRVVVADDSDDMRDLIRASLRAYGDFEVVAEARTGAEAIELAASLEPEVVLLDLSMPVMGGLAALPAIRSAAPDTTVVVFSAFPEEEVMAEASGLGARGFGVKGMHPKALAALVESSVSDGRPRVLVVEEEDAAWGPYIGAARAAGCVVTRAGSAKEAVGLVTYRNFDLVLLGLRLRDGDGLTVLRALADMDPQVPLPVVITVSRSMEAATINSAFQLGATACYTTARLAPADLGDSIMKWLDNGGYQRST